MKIRQDKESFNIGTNLRKFRKEKKMTQEQVVIEMQLLNVDISRGSYSHIKCGIGNIKVAELLALSEIFEVPLITFFDGMSLPKSP